MLPLQTTPKVTAGLRWPPEICMVAETKAPMVKPCASATASTSCPAVLMAPIPTKMRANVPMNSAMQGRSFSIAPSKQKVSTMTTLACLLLLWDGIAGLASMRFCCPSAGSATPFHSLREQLAAGVIRVFIAELFGHAIGFLFLSGLLVGKCRFLQSARSNRGIVIEQRDTHESFARFVEMLALDEAGKAFMGVALLYD